MKKNHAYGLRPYHNPENIDESLVPDGWRFRYADEMPRRNSKARLYLIGEWCFSLLEGSIMTLTYIVPVA